MILLQKKNGKNYEIGWINLINKILISVLQLSIAGSITYFIFLLGKLWIFCNITANFMGKVYTISSDFFYHSYFLFMGCVMIIVMKYFLKEMG